MSKSKEDRDLEIEMTHTHTHNILEKEYGRVEFAARYSFGIKIQKSGKFGFTLARDIVSRAILCRAQCRALNNNSRSNDNNNNNNKHKSSNNNNRSNIYRQNPQESVASLTKTIPNTKPKISGFRIQGVFGGSGGRGGRRGDDDRGNDVVGEEE